MPGLLGESNGQKHYLIGKSTCKSLIQVKNMVLILRNSWRRAFNVPISFDILENHRDCFFQLFTNGNLFTRHRITLRKSRKCNTFISVLKEEQVVTSQAGTIL
jgi:hypothetical protein